MKLRECNLVQLEQQKQQLIENSDEDWKQSIPYKERMAEINYCIEVLKLHKPCVTNSALKITPISTEISPQLQVVLDTMEKANNDFDKAATELLMIPKKYFRQHYW